MSGHTPGRIDRPDIVIPDASPLIHLAQAGALHLLHDIGGVVVVVDMVADEVTRDPAKPGSDVLSDWMHAGQQPGSNAPVRVEQTETGRAVAVARRSEPEFVMRNGGETAIVEWLAETVQGTDHATIVLYENGRVPQVIRNQGLDADIDVVTTRAFLELAEQRQLLPSADATWAKVVAVAPTANPRVEFSSQRRGRPVPTLE